jgi:glyoxylate reductase
MASPERPSILVTRHLIPSVEDALRERCDVDLFEGESAIPRDELLERIRGKVAAVTMLTERVDAEFLDAAGPGLVVVANHAVGLDNVDLPECTGRGVLVANTPEVLTDTTADLTWALLLAAARRIAEGDRFLRSRTPWIWAPTMMLGQDVHGATLGVVGFGRIGQAVARRGLGFGMRVLYHDVVAAPEASVRELGAERVGFDELLERSDFVVLNVALTAETRHLFGQEQFRRMKPTAVLVNSSRGPVVDEAALAAALRAGEIFAAGLDVFEREPEVHPDLLECPSAVIVPHLGSASVATRTAMGMLAAENVFAALDGRRPPTLANPEAWEARAGA